MTLKEYLTPIANQFRKILGTTKPINAQDFVDKINEVKIFGYNEGMQDGYNKGVEDGKQAEYDAFWDSCQQNGNRTNYAYGFSGHGWNKETFRPKHPITMDGGGGAYCFFRANQVEPFNADTAIDFDSIGIETSELTNATYMFANCNCKNITVDLSNCTSLNYTFNLSGGGYLDNITLKVSDKLTSVSNPFGTCQSLTKLTFIEGSVIACNGFNFQWSTLLSKASIINAINALSLATSKLSITFSLAAIKKAFETSSGANDGNTSTEWLNLIATKSNWTINLV